MLELSRQPAAYRPSAAGAFQPAHYLLLLVDSDAPTRRELGQLLRAAGFRTLEFGNAEALLDCVDALPDPCCVLSEISLDGMSGLDLLRAMRSRRRQLPFIMLTGQEDVALAVAALRSNVSDYLTRPVTERDLINRLRNVLTASAGDSEFMRE